MNIIFISAELPYPNNSGGRIYTWERLKQLKKNNNEIFLFTLKENDEFIDYDNLNRVCHKVNVYERKSKFKKGLLNINKPYSVISRYNEKMYNDINKLIKDDIIDIIIIDIPEVLLNCPMDNDIVKILTQHNIEYEVFRNIAKNSKNIIKKLIFYSEYIKMKKFETKFYNSKLINGYVFISEDDSIKFNEMFKIKHYVIISQGFDIKVSNSNQKQKNEKIILFTGKMNYQPNVEAVKWFCTSIFPHIRQNINDVKFYIVGKQPTDEVKALATNDIIITGEVETVKPYFNMADLFVIPLKSGGGVKIKTFEALGNGLIVITTYKGIEGTLFEDGIHVILANDEEKFIESSVKILNNPDKYENLINNSLKLIRKNYSWDAIGKKYNDFLTGIKR